MPVYKSPLATSLTDRGLQTVTAWLQTVTAWLPTHLLVGQDPGLSQYHCNVNKAHDHKVVENSDPALGVCQKL